MSFEDDFRDAVGTWTENHIESVEEEKDIDGDYCVQFDKDWNLERWETEALYDMGYRISFSSGDVVFVRPVEQEEQEEDEEQTPVEEVEEILYQHAEDVVGDRDALDGVVHDVRQYESGDDSTTVLVVCDSVFFIGVKAIRRLDEAGYIISALSEAEFSSQDRTGVFIDRKEEVLNQ